jgi:hypothetical protein
VYLGMPYAFLKKFPSSKKKKKHTSEETSAKTYRFLFLKQRNHVKELKTELVP